MNYKSLLLTALFAVSSFLLEKEPPKIQSDLETKVDDLAKRYLELGRFSGNILVYKNDSIVFDRYYGMADYSANKSFTENTSFGVGELSELFTEAIIRDLAEEQKVRMNDKVSVFIPEITADYTVADLINHQSGLPTIEAIRASNPGLEYSPVAFANAADLKPENKMVKSDLGYNILGLVIEKLGNGNFQQVLAGYAQKWELHNTFLNDKNAALQAKGYGYSNYNGQGLELKELPDLDSAEAFSSRGIKSTGRDLYKLVRQLPKGTIEMDGYFDGYSHSISTNEETGLTIIILSNRRHPVASEMSESIASIFLNEDYEIPLPRKQVAVDPTSFSAFVGSYALNPEMALEVVRSNDSLFLMMGPNKVHLKPQSRNQFYLEEADSAIRFVSDSTNQVSKAILYDGFLHGNEIKKIK